MRLPATVVPVSFAFSLLCLWQAVTQALSVPSYLLPSPLEIARELIRHSGYFATHTAVTVTEAVVGLGLALAVGVGSSVVFVRFPFTERISMPIAIASQATPIIAIAPLLTVWLGNGPGSKVAMAALLCFFPVLVGTTRGLRSLQPEHHLLARVYRASRWHVFWKMRVPLSVPQALAGIRVAASLSMIGAIVGEYAGANRGLGYAITQAAYRLDTPKLFAAIFCSVAAGLALFGSVALAEQIVSRKLHLPTGATT